MSRSLVLTGMHRSGTSLLASVLMHAGVDFGSAFLPPGRGNRRGHFEDLDFYRFHLDCLERRKVNLFAVPEDWRPDLTAEEDAEARALAARRAEIPLWGFKDPRTTLFLEAWERLLPDPLFLLVYRHPVEVALSLLRRGNDPEIQNDPRIAFKAWMTYNERLLRFRRAHPARSLLWNVSGAVGSLDSSLAFLEAWIGMRLDTSGAGDLFYRDELLGLQAREIDWPSIVPEAFELYRRLEEAGDLPAAAREEDALPPQVRELLESNEHLLAATLRATASMNRAETLSAAQVRDFARVQRLAAKREEELQSVREGQAVLEATMGMRTLRRYWSAVTRMRGWLRRLRSSPAPDAPAGSSSLSDQPGALPS